MQQILLLMEGFLSIFNTLLAETHRSKFARKFKTESENIAYKKRKKMALRHNLRRESYRIIRIVLAKMATRLNNANFTAALLYT